MSTQSEAIKSRPAPVGASAAVVLEDGTVYEGHGFGASGAVYGEIVFNTAMTGYQEVLTDPSYFGQMVTFTYPLIGNYGASNAANESDRVHSRAVIVREGHNLARNSTAEQGFAEWLGAQGVTAVSGIDTRALTRRLRSAGAMRACVYWGDFPREEIARQLRETPLMTGRDLVGEVTCQAPYELEFLRGKCRVVALDYGIKRSIIKRLGAAGCNVTVVPAATSAADILALRPDGVFLSNGPGDPAPLTYAVETVRKLVGKVPVFGICLGHQILSQALGLSTYKLKFGHRGANHPVKNLDTGHVEITSQNHGFAVELPAAIGERLALARSGNTFFEAPPSGGLLLDTEAGKAAISHLNLYDGTVEGIRCLEAPAFSVQYHPEASPGPHDSRYLFDEFVKLMKAKGGVG
ncbi:MAG: glutamine-hydrolyzing carbamoyl-phosphate synthase small subunit [Thermoleophilia bacterium]